jgi:hypothetical protein
MNEKQNKEPLMCTDTCEHCHYIEEGDFVCDTTMEDVVIVGWCPMECICPKKRRIRK